MTAAPTHDLPSHHLSEDWLVDYASGALPEALALAVAAHLALCPSCRAQEAKWESVGGALLDSLPPSALRGGALDAVLARLPADEEPAAPAPTRARASSRPALPEPLRSRVGGDLNAARWRRITRSLDVCDLPGTPGYAARLMRIAPGVAMPHHTHRGVEMTLVLAGGFTDASGHYLRGDVAVTDPSVEHQPIADEGEPCVCLAVTDAPLKLTGWFGRLLNPFLRF